MTENTCYSLCYSCRKKTNHQIICNHSEFDDDSFINYEYQIVKCLGCNRFGFRFVETDGYEWEEDEFGNRHYFYEEETYPKSVSMIDGEWHLPRPIRNIYRETLLAIQNESYTLAGLGLRITLEDICRDKNIENKRNLKEKIDQLVKLDLIVKRDADLLHYIRDLGNDAAHNANKPNRQKINAALQIIEHLMGRLYILEKQIEGVIHRDEK